MNECDDIIAAFLFLKVAKEPQEYNISYSKRTRHLSVMLVHDTHARRRADTHTHTHTQVCAGDSKRSTMNTHTLKIDDTVYKMMMLRRLCSKILNADQTFKMTRISSIINYY